MKEMLSEKFGPVVLEEFEEPLGKLVVRTRSVQREEAHDVLEVLHHLLVYPCFHVLLGFGVGESEPVEFEDVVLDLTCTATELVEEQAGQILGMREVCQILSKRVIMHSCVV